MNTMFDTTNNNELNVLYDQFASTVSSEEHDDLLNSVYDYLNIYEDDDNYIINGVEYNTLTDLINDNLVVQNQLIAELNSYN